MPGDDHPFAGLHLSLLESLVDGDAGAEHRRRRPPVQLLGQTADKVRIGQRVFAEAAVDRVAGVLLSAAKGFPPGAAVLAGAAGGVQPGHSHAIALLHPRDAAAERRDDTDTLVPWDEGRLRLHRPVAAHCVQVGVAYAGRGDAHQDLPRAGLRHTTSSITNGWPSSRTTAAFIIFAMVVPSAEGEWPRLPRFRVIRA